MEIKFFTGDRILDLTGQKISSQESNSRMNDKMFSKFFFPFEIYMNEEFHQSFGDYESTDSLNLQNNFEGLLLWESRIHKAKLQLLSIEGRFLTGQIDFGFEDLPNFDKKLAELPLHNFKVTDIYAYAKSIAGKKYPETDFNFPRMYTTKYPPDQALWDAFDGYYNDLKPDGSEMRRNYIDDQGNIFNVNILHPTPHFLYVLKTGFADAGLTLAGDILTDPIFSQRWIFSGTEYFSRLTQLRTALSVNMHEYDTYFVPVAIFDKPMTIAKKGRYKIVGSFLLEGIKSSRLAGVGMNGAFIWSVGANTYNSHRVNFNIDLTTTADNTVIYFHLERAFKNNVTEPVIIAEIIGESLEEPAEGEDNGVITNLNEVNLTRAVPDMTFGEFVNIIRNRFNYDVDVVDNVIYMNRLGARVPENVRDMQAAEVDIRAVKRTLLGKRSFLLRAPEDEKKPENSMYYDATGAFLNKPPLQETTIIEANCIIIKTGVAKPQGYDTAIIKKDTSDALQLVYYDGLTGVQNNAKNPPGADFPELFYTHWEKWLRQRILGMEYQWKFYWPADLFEATIKDYIFAYNNIHNIKSWTKDLVEDTYEIDMITETII